MRLPWTGLLELEEAPVDWLLQTGFLGFDRSFAKALSAYFVCLAWMLIAKGQLLAGIPISVFGIVSFATSYITSHFSLSPSHAEKMLASSYTLGMLGVSWIFLDVQDSVFRNRSLGMLFIFSKAALPMMGFRVGTAAIVLGVLGVNEVIATFFITRTYEESNDILIRLPGLLLLYSLMDLVAIFNQQKRWCMLYDTQVSLSAEKAASNEMKAAMESLLSMVCDSVFWLSADEANCVSRSSPQFDAIMGQTMKGVDFSKINTDAECRKFLKQWRTPGLSPVSLFPTSLALSSSQTVNADLFIVDQRQPMSQTGLESVGGPRQSTKTTNDGMGFLVGLRLCEGFAIEPPYTLDSPHAGATSSATCDQLGRPSQKPGEYLSPDGGSDCNTLPPDDKIQWLNTKRTAMPSTSFSLPKSSLGTSSDDGTSVSASHAAPKGILRSRSKNAMMIASDAHGGPVVGSPFRVSDEYLRQSSLSFLEDLISSWNFSVKGCCAWHASVQLMQDMVHYVTDSGALASTR